MGFFDEISIGLGEQWTQDLAEALRTAKVLVCFYSRSFFNSEFCGKEVQVFLSRVQEYRRSSGLATHPPVIIPVLWERPEKLPKIPPPLKGIQYTNVEFGDFYNKNGLEHIIRLRRYRDQDLFLLKFRDKIVDVANKYPLPPLAVMPSFEEVESAFHALAADAESGGPDFVQFAFLDRSGPDWRPYGASDQRAASAVEIAREAATDEKVRHRILPVEGLKKNLRDAEDKNTIVAVLVNSRVTLDPSYQRIIQDLDEGLSKNCAVFVLHEEVDGMTETERAAIREAVVRTFHKASMSPDIYFQDTIRSLEDEVDPIV